MINAYYNGIYSSEEDVLIPLSDRSVFFGDAVYEVILGRNGRLYQREAHIARLRRSCELVGIGYPKGIETHLDRLISLNEFTVFSVYIQVGRCYKSRIHAPKDFDQPSLLITIAEAHPEEYRINAKAITARDRRHDICNAKTVNLLPNVLSSIEATKSDADEAILIKEGRVTEGAKSSVLIIRDGILRTHPLTNAILPGVTRRKVIELSSHVGLRVLEKPFTVAELLSADEVLLSSTTKLLRRVNIIDGIEVGGRAMELARELSDALYSDYLNETS